MKSLFIASVLSHIKSCLMGKSLWIQTVFVSHLLSFLVKVLFV